MTETIDVWRKAPVLSAKREHELSLRMVAGDRQARAQLIEGNLRHAAALAWKYRRYGLPVADLLGEASVGLTHAADKFDPAHGVRFLTYAAYWMRNCILQYVIRSWSLVSSHSGSMRSKEFFRLRRQYGQLLALTGDRGEVLETLGQMHGRSPDYMAEQLGRIAGRDVSMDAPLASDSGGLTMVEQLVDGAARPDEQLEAGDERRELQGRIREALAALPDERERAILQARYFSGGKVSLAELARQLGLSRERIRQLEARALQRLRHYLTYRCLPNSPQTRAARRASWPKLRPAAPAQPDEQPNASRAA